MYISLLVVLFLMGCNTPSPAFRGIAPTRVTVEGSTFDIRVNGLRAEAMRVNAQYAPRFGIIETRAAAAMQQVSGCDVTAVTGDQALAFGKLKCNGKAAPPDVVPLALECVPVRGSEVKEVGQVRIDLDCDPA